MNLDKQFSTENLMMSVLGHLILVSLMITSVAIVVRRAQNVVSDHVQIMEIDLSQVKVTGDETKLYNTSTPAPVVDAPKPEPVAAPEPAKTEPSPQQEEVPEDDVPLETPSLVEDKPTPKPEPVKEEKTEPETPGQSPEAEPSATKKKTVVRVNREVMSLDRTLTVSVVDALRVALTRCWTIDTRRVGDADARAVAHLTMNKNGTVRDLWFEAASRAETDAEFAYVLDTIRSAINVCQPFKMLPEGEFSKWEKIQLTFYPNNGTVM